MHCAPSAGGRSCRPARRRCSPGVVQSLTTRWGLLGHYWVIAKLALTVVAAGVLLLYMGTLGEGGTDNDPTPLVHALAAIVLLVLTTGLSVYKPPGTTRWAPTTANASPPPPNAPPKEPARRTHRGLAAMAPATTDGNIGRARRQVRLFVSGRRSRRSCAPGGHRGAQLGEHDGAVPPRSRCRGRRSGCLRLLRVMSVAQRTGPAR